MEEFDDLLWMLVHRHINTNDLEGELERTKNDLFSLAREAALIAIAKYKNDRGMKLSTWIAENVKGALSASNRYKHSRLFIGIERECLPDESSYTPDELEFNITMKQLLSDLHYEVYFMRFVEDRSEREIAKEMKLSRAEVRECLFHILRQYELIVKSRNQVLTTRRLQDNWLNDSDQLLKE